MKRGARVLVREFHYAPTFQKLQAFVYVVAVVDLLELLESDRLGGNLVERGVISFSIVLKDMVMDLALRDCIFGQKGQGGYGYVDMVAFITIIPVNQTLISFLRGLALSALWRTCPPKYRAAPRAVLEGLAWGVAQEACLKTKTGAEFAKGGK